MIDEREVQIPDYFRAFIAHYFDDLGRNWLAEIPSLVARYAEAWDLDVQPPFHGLTYNYVAPVRRRDGSWAVLKVGLPEQEQRAEIFALRAFDGRGIIRLYEFDIEDHVALIEYLSPGRTLELYFPDQDDEATEIAAEIAAELAIPAPVDHSEFSTIEGWFSRGLGGLRRKFDGGAGPFPTVLVDRAEGLYRELLASTNREYLIHGDLHHGNILSSDTHGGWVAIDPKGLVGDRAYEPAPFILNPHSDIHTLPDIRRILTRRVDQFAEALEIDRYRIHGWALAFAVLSAWWTYDSIGARSQTIDLGEILAGI